MKLSSFLLTLLLGVVGVQAGTLRNTGGRSAIEEKVKKAIDQQLEEGHEQVRELEAEPHVDYSCSTCGDCAVKNVGSCCGAAPKCVNRNFTPDPEAMDEWCKGRGGECGFEDIDICTCEEGVCVGYASVNSPEKEKCQEPQDIVDLQKEAEAKWKRQQKKGKGGFVEMAPEAKFTKQNKKKVFSKTLEETAKNAIDQELEEAKKNVKELEREEDAIANGDEDPEDAFLGSEACLPFMKKIMEAIEEATAKPSAEIVEETCSDKGRNVLWKEKVAMEADSKVYAKKTLTRRRLKELEGAPSAVTLDICIKVFEKKLLHEGKKKLDKSIHSHKDCRKEVRQEMRQLKADGLNGRMLLDFNAERPADPRLLWGWISRAWNHVMTGVKKAVVVVAKAIKKVIKVAKVAVVQAVKVVGDTVGEIVNSVAEGKFGEIMGHIGDAGKDLVKIGVNATKEIVEIGKEAGKELVGIGKDTAREVAKEALDAAFAAKELAVAAARKACNETSLAAETTGNRLIAEASDYAMQATDSLGAICKRQVNALDDSAEQAIAAAEETVTTALDSGMASHFNISEGVGGGVEAAQEARTTALEAALSVCNATDAAADRIVNGRNVATEGFTELMTNARDLCHVMINTVNEKYDPFVESAREYLDSLIGSGTGSGSVPNENPVLTITEEGSNITGSNTTKAASEKSAAISAGEEGVLPLLKRDEPCTASFPCDACEGDCDEDEDCRGELMCKMRDHNFALRPIGHGCAGSGEKGNDYCYAPGRNKTQTSSGAEDPLNVLSEQDLEDIEDIISSVSSAPAA